MTRTLVDIAQSHLNLVCDSAADDCLVFHDRTLKEACGKSGRVAAYKATELESMSYLTGDDRIIRLETALKSCHRLGSGVMLDLKVGVTVSEFFGNDWSVDFIWKSE